MFSSPGGLANDAVLLPLFVTLWGHGPRFAAVSCWIMGSLPPLVKNVLSSAVLKGIEQLIMYEDMGEKKTDLPAPPTLYQRTIFLLSFSSLFPSS